MLENQCYAMSKKTKHDLQAILLKIGRDIAVTLPRKIIRTSKQSNKHYQKPMDHKFISSKNFFSGVRKAVSLYKNIWREGTTALIHGPREADKSARALDIALDVAHTGRRVLYANAEDRLDRVAADDAGHDNLYVFTPEFSALDDSTDYADLVFEAIGQAVRTTDIRTFVIDSVSRIAALSFGRNASPAYIMKRLVALQVKCRLSVLVVADDATKTVNNALFALASVDIADEGSDNSDLSGRSGSSDKSDSTYRSDNSEPSRPSPSKAERRRAEKAMRKYSETLNRQKIFTIDLLSRLLPEQSVYDLGDGSVAGDVAGCAEVVHGDVERDHQGVVGVSETEH